VSFEIAEANLSFLFHPVHQFKTHNLKIDIYNIYKHTVIESARYGARLRFSSNMKDRTLLLNQPADHLESTESLLGAAIRNTLEESAYKFKPQYLMGIFGWSALVHVATNLRAAFTGHRLSSWNLE